VWWSPEEAVEAVTEPQPLATCEWTLDGVEGPITGAELTRPYAESPTRRAPVEQGFCLEPSPRPPKYLTTHPHGDAAEDVFGRRKPATPHAPSPFILPAVEPEEGRFPQSDIGRALDRLQAPPAGPRTAVAIEGPCFYDVERLAGGGHRITYWLFYPTSTLPWKAWEETVVRAAAILVDEKAAELPEPPAVDAKALSNLDALFAAEVKQGERVSWISPWGIAGDAAHHLLKYDNPVLDAAGAALTGFAMAYEIQYRLLLDAFLKAIGVLAPRGNAAAARRYIHEGDWEGVSVELDARDELQRVAYWGHGAPIVRDRDGVEIVEGTHVVGLAAVGSHATVPDEAAAGIHGERLSTGDDFGEWRTWEDLRPAPEQKLWYGFGGAWGRCRLAPIGRLPVRRLGRLDTWPASTGPLGPGPLKLAEQGGALAKVDADAGRAPVATVELRV
jgi:hypothetical protein